MCAYLAIFLVFLLFVASAARPWRPDAVVQREGLDCDCLALRSFQSLFSLCHLLNAVWRPASIFHFSLSVFSRSYTAKKTTEIMTLTRFLTRDT